MNADDVLFPYDKFRDVQTKLIAQVHYAVNNKKNLTVHAPTGIGKTAAALAAAIEAARTTDGPRTIFFLTSRQSQHKIVVDTVRRINARRPREDKVRLVDMVGQSSMCVQPFANEGHALFSLSLIHI